MRTKMIAVVIAVAASFGAAAMTAAPPAYASAGCVYYHNTCVH